MIIQIEGSTPEGAQAAMRALATVVQGWRQEIAVAPPDATAAAQAADHDAKGIDPMSLATLAVSIPSAALAVTDLADRIHKRRRAKELIDQAQQLATQHVSVRLQSQSRTIELHTTTPDQLLDLLADEDSAR